MSTSKEGDGNYKREYVIYHIDVVTLQCGTKRINSGLIPSNPTT
jgi:hypothetical protein